MTRIDSWKEDDMGLPEELAMPDEVDQPKDSVIDQMTIYRTDINWIGTRSNFEVETGRAKQGYNNYYLPTCPDGALNVLSYEEVTFKNLYEGIDLKWYSNEGALEYDFIVSPNTDYSQIKWEIQGAEEIAIGQEGQLIISTPLGKIEEQAPIAYQGEQEVEVEWALTENQVGFSVKDYNKDLTLRIDPLVRAWGTYYGGSSDEYTNFKTFEIDGGGNPYICGYTDSPNNIASSGAHQTTYGGGGLLDAFVVKFNSSGVRQWGTYYGGSGNDVLNSIAFDGSGNPYICGGTSSPNNIASSGAHQTTYGGGADAFLVKFNSSGVRQWGTYYGGSGDDVLNSMALDGSGNPYICGGTSSPNNIASSGAHQTTYGGGFRDAFVVKFNSSGVRQWGTYYGGSVDDYFGTMALNVSGNAFLIGGTDSPNNIASSGAHQTTYGGGFRDAFVVKFNSSGVRQWGTYYGGSGGEAPGSMALDGSGNPYICGYTDSPNNIASSGAYQTTAGGGDDAFFVKFNSNGIRQWGTFYGGSGNEFLNSIAFDGSGNPYICGYTDSPNNIASSGAHQTTYGGGNDLFLVKFNSSGVRQWGTYYGGSNSDITRSIAFDGSGNPYIYGQTSSPNNIASSGAYQTNIGGGGLLDAFVVKFNSSGVRQWGTYYGGSATERARSMALDGSGNPYICGYTDSPNNIASSGAYQTTPGGGNDLFLVKFGDCTESYGQDTITACDSYTWIDGVIYTLSDTTAMYTLVNAAGCDSIVSLNLTINYTQTSTDSVVANDTYTWIDGVTYTSSNNTATHTLIASNGCDSIVTLNLTLILGLNNLATLSNVKVYPNPTNGKLTIDAENFEGVEVYDVSGRLILESELKTIDLEGQSKGLYLLKINANGTKQEFKVLKE